MTSSIGDTCLTNNKLILTVANTDNMGKLFVMVFAFAPTPKTALLWYMHPDTRICPQLKSCTVTDF
jgi:hypothetical protein